MTTLQGWAEQVLLGQTLGDKLLPPVGDDVPRSFAPPDAPGRPPELGLCRRPSGRAPRPGQLGTARQRGRVLHLFANHELLALELMAVGILRFPEAPRAFRRGLAGVIAEEQEHLALYLGQLDRCGIALGTEPVGAFFWDALHRIDDPGRLVAGLALTLEQANLDFSREWAAAFRAVGDAETAAVLDRVYEDEIRHVRHGLHWFQTWNPDGDLFTSYAAALRPPLGPHRARGTGRFDAEGRAAAGLPADFVDRVRTFGASRGRSPDVYWFNPGVESEVREATPPGLLTALERDLAVLPAVLAGRDDAVLVARPPGVEWQKSMLEAGFPLPAFVTGVEGPVRRLRPWGWSRRAAAALRGTAPAGHGDRLARTWWCDRPVPGLDPRDRPAVARTADEAVAAVGAIGGGWVIKSPFSAGGRDRIRGDGPLTDLGWVNRTLAAQGAVVVERWLDGVVDLSILAEDGRRLGITRFAVRGGAWAGHLTGRWTEGLPPSILRFVHEHRVAAALDAAAAAVDPGGVYGVDALIYREDGHLRLRPVIEVNARMTFGRVALALGQRQHPRATGWLAVVRRGALAQVGLTPATFAQLLRAEAPVKKLDGRPASGACLLNDPAADPEHLAVWWLAPCGGLAALGAAWLARGPGWERLAPPPAHATVVDPLPARAHGPRRETPTRATASS